MQNRCLSTLQAGRLLLAVALLSWPTIAAHAQASIDLKTQASRDLTVESLKGTAKAEKALALKEAQAKGWPISGTTDEGNYFELIRVDDGRPVYFATMNANAAISTGTNLVRSVAPYGVSGDGMSIGVWDGGAVRVTHQEFNPPARVTVRDGAAPASASIWHPTHVAGTIGARGAYAPAKGMAPNVLIESFDWNEDVAEMTSRAASDESQSGFLLLSNHSYGTQGGWERLVLGATTYTLWYGRVDEDEDRDFGKYGSIAASWDAVCYAAPYYLPFKAAGNDRDDVPPQTGTPFYYWDASGMLSEANYAPGLHPPGDAVADGGYDTIADAGIAKNAMTVGAVNDAAIGGLRDLASATMAPFSGWGPADDGRIKPDIVANGVDLVSPFASSNSSYATSGGTSQSTPNASGSAVLLAEYYQSLFPRHVMRASTLKGLIIHTADDRGNPGPDYQFGWGLMNTEAAAAHIRKHYDDPDAVYMTEQRLGGTLIGHNWVLPVSGDAPLRVTLTWTDPPPYSPTADGLDLRDPVLVHDLDLRVVHPNGTTSYLPYVLDVENPALPAATGDNTVDNVEQVYIQNPVAGNYTVRIRYKGTFQEQYYSLLVSGHIDPDLPVLSVLPPSQTIPSSGGAASFTVTNSGGGTLNWTAPSPSFSPSSGLLPAGSSVTVTLAIAAGTELCETVLDHAFTAAGPVRGAPANVETVQEADVLEPPVSIEYPPSSITGSFSVSWPSAGPNVCYTLERSSDGGVTWKQVDLTTDLEYSEDAPNGSFRYRVRAGTGAWRTGTHDCIVTRPALAVSPSEVQVAYSGGPGKLTVLNFGSAFFNWSATVTAGADWLSVSGGGTLHPGLQATLNYTAAENTTKYSRMGTIEVSSTQFPGASVQITVVQAKVPISITPARGSEAGGTLVTIPYGYIQAPQALIIGGNYAVNQPPSAYGYTFLTPPGIGVVDVTLLTSSRSYTLTDGFTYISPAEVWTKVTEHAAWSGRMDHASAVYDNKLWVLGGTDGLSRNDVWWTTDGSNWTQATANAGWTARRGLRAEVFDNKLWVIGGGGQDDVWWTTDGANWTEATGTAGWAGRTDHATAVHDGMLWVMGSAAVPVGPPAAGFFIYSRDVWSSGDGSTWTQAIASAPWTGRIAHETTAFQEKMWLSGGQYRAGTNLSYSSFSFGDVWSSTDGQSWTEEVADAPWHARAYHTMLAAENKLWILGGEYSTVNISNPALNESGTFNDVWWSANGTDWRMATPAADWLARRRHAAAYFDGKLWVLGGNVGAARWNDVWSWTPYVDERDLYGLSYQANSGGELVGNTEQIVAQGEDGAPVGALAAGGYQFVQWSDGATINPRHEANVISNVNITALFARKTYSLHYFAEANGSLNGTLDQVVQHGLNGAPVEAVADAGYEFLRWSDGVAENPRQETNVSTAMSVTAWFVESGYMGLQASIGGLTPVTKYLGESHTFDVSVSGAVGPVLYQWRRSTEEKSYQDVLNATLASLTFNNLDLDDAGLYICEVSDSLTTVQSAPVELIVLNIVAVPLSRLPLLSSVLAIVVLAIRVLRRRRWTQY